MTRRWLGPGAWLAGMLVGASSVCAAARGAHADGVVRAEGPARADGVVGPEGVARADGVAHADGIAPPWVQAGEVPPPPWARSVAPKPGEGGRPGDMRLVVEPTLPGAPRGLTAEGASLPFFGSKRGSGCTGRFWLVGPLAWVCSDGAELSAAQPSARAPVVGPDARATTYFFVKADGAGAYVSLASAREGAPDQDLEGGWAVAIVEQRSTPADAAGGRAETWGRTSHGLWIAMRDLVEARKSLFHGETLDGGGLDFAWVVVDNASVWSAPVPQGKPIGLRERFARVSVREEKGPMVRIDEGAWVLSRELARPALAEPPAEVVRPFERWIDIDLATQTLVAYEGPRPLYATLVSTGRGPVGSPTATPPGVHRIWVKLEKSDMDNVNRDESAAHYSMEDVPDVQFFDHAVALHGTYWHGDFGHVRSHGCVNLAPLDARWLFAFTEPHLGAGWVAAYPTPFDPGTVVRVR